MDDLHPATPLGSPVPTVAPGCRQLPPAPASLAASGQGAGDREEELLDRIDRLEAEANERYDHERALRDLAAEMLDWCWAPGGVMDKRLAEWRARAGMDGSHPVPDGREPHECSFPVLPPDGTIFRPGPCEECGKAYAVAVAERELAEAQAALNAARNGEPVVVPAGLAGDDCGCGLGPERCAAAEDGDA